LARDGAALAARLKLKNADRERLAAFATASQIDPIADERAGRRAIYRLGAPLYRDLALLRGAETGDAAGARAALALADAWRKPRFPLGGRDLMARGLTPGPEIGQLLAEIEAWWEAGDFRAARSQCLAELARRIGLSRGSSPASTGRD
jgi:poly(A) polymerase